MVTHYVVMSTRHKSGHVALFCNFSNIVYFNSCDNLFRAIYTSIENDNYVLFIYFFEIYPFPTRETRSKSALPTRAGP